MVILQKNRLIIVIETASPVDLLESLQKGIINALQNLKEDSEQCEHPPVYYLSSILAALLPDYDQMQKGMTDLIFEIDNKSKVDQES